MYIYNEKGWQEPTAYPAKWVGGYQLIPLECSILANPLRSKEEDHGSCIVPWALGLPPSPPIWRLSGPIHWSELTFSGANVQLLAPPSRA
jgi:hypothetical protein